MSLHLFIILSIAGIILGLYKTSPLFYCRLNALCGKGKIVYLFDKKNKRFISIERELPNGKKYAHVYPHIRMLTAFLEPNGSIPLYSQATFIKRWSYNKK